ncbi:MAG: hypothetical protein R3F43_27705 [bacterium]
MRTATPIIRADASTVARLWARQASKPSRQLAEALHLLLGILSKAAAPSELVKLLVQALPDDLGVTSRLTSELDSKFVAPVKVGEPAFETIDPHLTRRLFNLSVVIERRLVHQHSPD